MNIAAVVAVDAVVDLSVDDDDYMTEATVVAVVVVFATVVAGMTKFVVVVGGPGIVVVGLLGVGWGAHTSQYFAPPTYCPGWT